MRIDLTMWAKNGAQFLPFTLKRIDEVIPEENVGQKIFIDDHSTDESTLLAKDFSWNIYTNLNGGIGNGANLALSKVRTPLFASFEQDIFLNRYWFNKILPWLEKPSVAVAQGWRLSTNPTQKALEEFGMEWFGKIPLYSIDNNLYRTEAIRLVGGFPNNVEYCIDGVLRARLERAGWLWVTDQKILSAHLKPLGIINYAKRYSKSTKDAPIMLAEGLLTDNEIKKLKLQKYILMTMLAPIIGTGMAFLKKNPILAVYYSLVRLYRFKGYIIGKACLK